MALNDIPAKCPGELRLSYQHTIDMGFRVGFEHAETRGTRPHLEDHFITRAHWLTKACFVHPCQQYFCISLSVKPPIGQRLGHGLYQYHAGDDGMLGEMARKKSLCRLKYSYGFDQLVGTKCYRIQK